MFLRKINLGSRMNLILKSGGSGLPALDRCLFYSTIRIEISQTKTQFLYLDPKLTFLDTIRHKDSSLTSTLTRTKDWSCCPERGRFSEGEPTRCDDYIRFA